MKDNFFNDIKGSIRFSHAKTLWGYIDTCNTWGNKCNSTSNAVNIMPNIVLTTKCNQRCAYCFASAYTCSTSREMSDAVFDDVLHFLRINRETTVRLVGGEPTLHPRFSKFVDRSIRKGFRVSILSNGLWPRKVHTHLRQIDPTQISYLINVNHPTSYSKGTWKSICDTLSFLSTYTDTALSINLDKTNSDFEYIIETAKRFDIRSIRFSIVRPSLDAPQIYDPPSDFIEIIASLQKQCADAGILCGSDCTFITPCRIENAPGGKRIANALLFDATFDPIGSCSPSMDIFPDFHAIYCFGIGKALSVDLNTHKYLSEIESIFFYAKNMMLKEDPTCSACSYYRIRRCLGGCWSERMLDHDYSDALERFNRLAKKTDLHRYPYKLTDGIKIRKLRNNGHVAVTAPPTYRHVYSTTDMQLMQMVLKNGSPEKRIEYYCKYGEVTPRTAIRRLNDFILQCITAGTIDFI